MDVWCPDAASLRFVVLYVLEGAALLPLHILLHWRSGSSSFEVLLSTPVESIFAIAANSRRWLYNTVDPPCMVIAWACFCR